MEIKNINIYNFYNAILGIRNSYKSKDKSDSKRLTIFDTNYYLSYNHCIIGQEDEKLIKKLLKSKNNPAYETQERKFLRQILVSMDVIGSIKFWAQFDTYKIATVRNSESTMHCITKGEIIQDDFERDINPEQLEYINDLIKEYNVQCSWAGSEDAEAHKRVKELFELIDANLPAGYLLESHYTCNYEVLRNIYHGRKNHKMFYWSQFCDYIEKLPYFDLLIKEID